MHNFALKYIQTIFFLPVLATVWIVDSGLPNGAVTGKYFWFYGAMVVISTIVFVSCLIERKKFRSIRQDFFVFLFCVSGLVLTWVHNRSISNKWVILLLVLPLYFCFRYTMQENRKSRYLMLFFLLFTGLFEALWGLGQLYGLYNSYHNLYPVTGSFFNPGPYAGYLSIVAPIAIFYCVFDGRVFQRKLKIRYWPFYLRGGLSILTIASILVILPSTMSRAAWIAFVSGIIWVFVFYYRRKRKTKKYFNLTGWKRKYIFIFMVCLLLAGMYYMKKDSADGRFLIWKVSAHIITHHPFGVGLDNFSGNYGERQSAYFATGAGSAQERYVAGSPDYGFNEFIQIGVEHGIHGLLLFITILFLAIYMGIKKKRFAETGSLVALLVFSTMSYPFSVLPFLIVLVFLLASCATDMKTEVLEKSVSRYVTVTIFGIFLAITFAGSYSRIATYQAFKKMNTSLALKIGGLSNEVLSLYAEIYPELKYETHFVFDYATILKDDGQYAESNRVLKQGMKISCDPAFYNLTGINHQLMKDNAAAEIYFRKAADMVPNRLYPYYLLAKLYLEMGLFDKACQMAEIVLTKEPKVYSQAVIDMRKEMEKIMIND